MLRVASYFVLLCTKDGGGEKEWPWKERVRIFCRIMKEMSSRDPNPPGIKCIHQILFFSFYPTVIAAYPVVYKNYETYFALCLLDTEYLIK